VLGFRRERYGEEADGSRAEKSSPVHHSITWSARSS